jgi:hypothetical protein
MPKILKSKLSYQSVPKSSTKSHLQLASFINIFKDIMLIACAQYCIKDLIYRVHMHSSRYNKYNRSNADNCDI